MMFDYPLIEYYDSVVAQKGQAQINLLKHKSVYHNKTISQNTNIFAETEIKTHDKQKQNKFLASYLKLTRHYFNLVHDQRLFWLLFNLISINLILIFLLNQFVVIIYILI